MRTKLVKPVLVDQDAGFCVPDAQREVVFVVDRFCHGGLKNKRASLRK